MPHKVYSVRAQRWAMVLIWLVPFLWTVNIVASRQAPGVVSPNVLALGRWALAGSILTVFSARELWQHRCVLWQQRWRYLLLGGCGMWICGAWVYLAGESTVSMNISLIYASSPVLIAMGSVLWLKEHFSMRQLWGVVLAMSGVVHVVVQGQWANLSAVNLVPGDLWILGAAVAWAAYALLQRRWPSVMSSTAQLAAICLGGVLVILPFALWELASAHTPSIGANALGLMVLTALLPGVMAYWIYGWAQKVLGASRVAVTLYLGPLYTAVVAWGVLNEPLGGFHLVGGLLILSGVALVMISKTRTD
jgi:drug/metabolite transporter (DMT)-like permease